ncbi:MAG TPA: hypothetical protein VNB49_11870 [Candidatus Dormibacteraeota bacterium]|nr:hypothetical protein [Candidatus Dormibacteraeota bacterium]
MAESRRRLLIATVGALGLLTLKLLLRGEQTPTRSSPKLHPYPNGRDPDNPQHIDEPSRLVLKAIQQENQRKLRADVSRLYEMAGDLKTDVEKTDATFTLSVSLVKKAQENEKLAKQIRNLAKGLS